MNSLEAILDHVMPNAQLHAKWLNTMSYLEYIGFRKIVKSHHSDRFSIDDLTHAVEEGRHALRLKKLAVRIGGAEFRHYNSESMLSKKSADQYFQALDHQCFQTTSNQSLSYLYVTLLVEVRALDVYQAYEKRLRAHALFSLKTLLEEEAGHLERVRVALSFLDKNFETRIPELQKVERALYENLVMGLGANFAIL